MIETLRTLAGAFAVSGCEQDMARCVLELAASYGTCGRDAMGNEAKSVLRYRVAGETLG